ncbi:hypothetical protein Q4566_07920 [Tamlana sp. 2_MG-2023]|uniref:hypothetical protein n=1 Tax=unclassified Tamlana TaxID=2614803 RepID=UPI0026E2B84A|nr:MULTISPECIES: hypothetical protein [unclassified Tamlana]MDO6760124.1 hypothetical protein [Tamlana sp. 2_MG-2023]MDO6790178.1 hypothetical protein [Tamlana sp. 1_MG-2023]
MKKTIVLLTSIAIFGLVGCGEKKEKETVVIEKKVEAPKAKESDGTSLDVSSDGVEFSSKSGKNKTEISIKD